ncbi:hypothetical protein MMC24_005173 [Lignoscripta atroalba]|nr:hypothetical protein [Lignoscripta atroalba]
MATTGDSLQGFDFPLAFPPPGVTSDFVNPTTQGSILIGISSVCSALVTFLFIIRIYTKVRITRKLGFDDSLQSGVGVHQWNVLVSSFTSTLLKKFFVIQVIVSPVILMVKLSLLLLYLQLFYPNVTLRYLIYFGILFNSLFYTACVLVQIILCSPRAGQSWFEVTLSPRYARTIPLGVVQAAVNVGGDFYILFLPIRGVWQLKLPLRKKIGVSAIFMSGFLACVSSILNLVYRLKLNRHSDVTWDLVPVFALTVLEINVGIMCGCMPTLPKFLHHHSTLLKPLQSLLGFASRKLDAIFTIISKKFFTITRSFRGVSNQPQTKEPFQFGSQDKSSLEHHGRERNVVVLENETFLMTQSSGQHPHWWEIDGLISNFSTRHSIA